MLLDNEKTEQSVQQWITQYIDAGRMDVVTGYFTIGAMAFMASVVRPPRATPQ